MSILKNMIDNGRLKTEYNADTYVNEGMCDCSKNSYYFLRGKYDVLLCNPEEIRAVLPEYSINFKTEKQARDFIFTNLYDEPYNIKMSIEGSSLMLKPIDVEYEVHFEVDNEQVAQELVKNFRRQYAKSNGFNIPPARPQQKTGEQSKEMESLGLDF